MEIKTKRLILRPVKKSDAKDIVKNINNLNISKWLFVVPYPYSMKDATSWIKSNQKKWKRKKKEDYSFGMELLEEKSIIGSIGLHKLNLENGTAELGYWIGEKYWRKGYGSEALKSILDLAFKKFKLRRLEAGVIVGNPSSGKLLEKFGFNLEGTKRKAIVPKATGKPADEYIYGLLREDYLSSNI